MHRSIAAAAAVVALTAALTACNGSDGDGDKAGSTKGTHSSGAAEPGGAESPEAAPSSASSTGAKLGDTLSLVGIVGLGQSSAPTADVTLNKFVDNAKAQGAYFEAADGNRLVAAEFTIVNTGKVTYSDAPYTPPTVVDTAGTAHNGKPGDPTDGESLSITMTLSQGERATGWVIFEVPKSAKIASVTWQMDRTGLDTERIGTWTL
ncbi:DUF4352 domain-containing protein [Streptomyces milbemycinicus]|uniref:DUF4352 domain-containing protein n=1 Tax=Streptomyces milbemycinicus TaxID=476552 RepID=A0ABW8LJL7_9ACTN